MSCSTPEIPPRVGSRMHRILGLISSMVWVKLASGAQSLSKVVSKSNPSRTLRIETPWSPIGPETSRSSPTRAFEIESERPTGTTPTPEVAAREEQGTDHERIGRERQARARLTRKGQKRLILEPCQNRARECRQKYLLQEFLAQAPTAPVTEDDVRIASERNRAGRAHDETPAAPRAKRIRGSLRRP